MLGAGPTGLATANALRPLFDEVLSMRLADRVCFMCLTAANMKELDQFDLTAAVHTQLSYPAMLVPAIACSAPGARVSGYFAAQALLL